MKRTQTLEGVPGLDQWSGILCDDPYQVVSVSHLVNDVFGYVHGSLVSLNEMAGTHPGESKCKMQEANKSLMSHHIHLWKGTCEKVLDLMRVCEKLIGFAHQNGRLTVEG